MEELDLAFMPLPHVFRGKRREGAQRAWPSRCGSCDRQCETGSNRGVLEVCSYGVNFLWLDDDLLLAGFAVHDAPAGQRPSHKVLRSVGRDAVRLEDVNLLVDRAADVARTHATAVRQQMDQIVREYRASAEYKSEIVDLLRPDIERALAQVHDYRTLMSQIVQNVNVILETQSPGLDFNQQIDRASKEVRSIYWAARLMEFKLQAALFLMYPDRIHARDKQCMFRLHGAVTKYAQIYQPAFDRAGIEVVFDGHSYGKLMGNPDAYGVIPHTFLDNAAKYAPRGSTVTLGFVETMDEIRFSATSFGPKIARDERESIFDLFFRGKAAVERIAEGTGFGLALAQHIAKEVGAELSVSQDSGAGPDGQYRTTFTAVFPKPREDERPPAIVRNRTRRRGGVLIERPLSSGVDRVV
jgi:signal transduction histidine kinase